MPNKDYIDNVVNKPQIDHASPERKCLKMGCLPNRLEDLRAPKK